MREYNVGGYIKFVSTKDDKSKIRDLEFFEALLKDIGYHEDFHTEIAKRISGRQEIPNPQRSKYIRFTRKISDGYAISFNNIAYAYSKILPNVCKLGDMRNEEYFSEKIHCRHGS